MARSDQEIEKRDAAKQRKAKGEQPASKRLASLRDSSDVDQFGWGEVDPRLIASLVNAVTKAGGAVMFSVTSDGGALGITFYDNGDRERVYLPKSSDMAGEFEYLIGLWF